MGLTKALILGSTLSCGHDSSGWFPPRIAINRESRPTQESMAQQTLMLTSLLAALLSLSLSPCVFLFMFSVSGLPLLLSTSGCISCFSPSLSAHDPLCPPGCSLCLWLLESSCPTFEHPLRIHALDVLITAVYIPPPVSSTTLPLHTSRTYL